MLHLSVGPTRWNVGIASTAVLATTAFGLSSSSPGAVVAPIGVLLAAPVLHEAVRAWASRRLGVTAYTINVTVFGGWQQPVAAPLRPMADVLVGLAGLVTAASLVAIVALVVAIADIPALGPAVRWLGAMAVLQCMPALPLDGGQIAKAVGWYLTDDRLAGVRGAALGARLVGTGLVVIGVIVVLRDGGGSFPYWSLWATVAGYQVIVGARGEARHALWLGAADKLLLRQVVQAATPRVASTTTVEAAIDRFLDVDPSAALFVADDGGRLIGAVTLAELRRVPRRSWRRLAIEQAMTPLDHVPRLSDDTTVAAAIAAMRRQRVTSVLIEGKGGSLAVATIASLERLLSDRNLGAEQQPAATSAVE